MCVRMCVCGGCVGGGGAGAAAGDAETTSCRCGSKGVHNRRFGGDLRSSGTRVEPAMARRPLFVFSHFVL